MKKKMITILAAGLCLFSQAVSVYGADYEYDDLGRVTKVVYEDGSSVTYTYDANGNIVEVLTGTEWEDEESGTGDFGAGAVAGEEGKQDFGRQNQSGKFDGSESRMEEVGGNDSAEDADAEKNGMEDGEENIDGNEGNKEEDKESSKSRLGNVIAAIIAVLGIAAILIQRLKSGKWNIAGAGKENRDGESNKDKNDKSGKETGENRGEGEAE